MQIRAGKNYPRLISAILTEVQSGRIPIKRINDCVNRILKMKKELGLFQNACAYRQFLPRVGSQSHRGLARATVRKSLVLLKNKDRYFENKPLFPIRLGSTRILVTGSHANDIGLQCGGYTITKEGSAGNITVGTTVFRGIEKVLAGKNGPVTPLLTQDPSGFEQADYGIIVVGEKPYSNSSNEPLILDSHSEKIINTVCFATPCILVVISGRPLKIDHLLPKIDAVVAAWLPGSEGIGIADVLLGDKYDFTGKLPVPWFKDPKRIGNENNTLYNYGFGLNKAGIKL
jgi:beta-glucosidase